VQVGRVRQHVGIVFRTAYVGDERKVRNILFIDGDITDPSTYKDVLKNGIDGYYQRAGREIPHAYVRRPSFIEVIAMALHPGGFFATDDHATVPPGGMMDRSGDFPVPYKELALPNAAALEAEI